MRGTLIGLATLLLTGGLTVLAGFAPANAHTVTGGGCPNDGTVPGTSDSYRSIGPNDGRPLTTIFIDDRDYLDLDGDGTAAGLWIYIESGHDIDLQRGGNQIAFTLGVDPDVPFIPPTQVVPPSPPFLPNGLTLFPGGLGGESTSAFLGFHDDCIEASPADIILF